MCEQMERDKRELLSQNDELKRELARPEASDISFDSSRRGSNAYIKKSAEHRAEELLEGHQWWCYIWHELRKQYKLDNDKRRIATAGDYDFETEDQNELHFQINKLKENLRAQAIEISSLRQVSLF